MASNSYWTIENIPDQTGKIAIVTGANSGLGYYTSKALASKGAHVILACRSLERGEQAVASILNEIPGASIELMQLDLADLAAVHDFAAAFARRYPVLDLLINNAGMMAIPLRYTKDGYEMQFGVNHLGHFALTGLLLQEILTVKAARVVTVSSLAHMIGRIKFGDINSQASYNAWIAYGQSKLANILFAFELQRRLEKSGRPAISLACHPGYAATHLQMRRAEMTGNRFQGRLMGFGNRLFSQPAEMGVLPSLYAATSPQAKGCDYIGPGGLFQRSGLPVKRRSNRASHDPETAARLWQISEELTGVRYQVI
jgi:NAD(P)-dependent dehydrogenase (short-subunit alcohol dehydrogenase family)